MRSFTRVRLRPKKSSPPSFNSVPRASGEADASAPPVGCAGVCLGSCGGSVSGGCRLLRPHAAAQLARCSEERVQRWLDDPGNAPPQVNGLFEIRGLVAFLRRRRRSREDDKADTTHHYVSLPGLRLPAAPSLTALLDAMSGAIVADDEPTVPRSERYGKGDWVSRERW